MICPLCHRPTKRMVYRRTGKCCPDCANPNFIQIVDIPVLTPDSALVSYLAMIDKMLANVMKN